MKIIELLNKIANGDMPEHIKFDTDDWYWGYDSYVPKNFIDTTPDVQAGVSLFKKYRIDYCLNDEIEIIEQPKKLEKITWNDKSKWNGKSINDTEMLMSRTEQLKKSLNEIIEKLEKGE